MELDAYTQLNCKLPTARDIYTCIYSKSFSIFNIYVYMCVCVCVTNTHKKLVNFCISFIMLFAPILAYQFLIVKNPNPFIIFTAH